MSRAIVKAAIQGLAIFPSLCRERLCRGRIPDELRCRAAEGQMIRITLKIGSLLCAFLPLTSNAQQVQIPSMLIGSWDDVTDGEKGVCTPRGKAKGLTITSDGKLIANDGATTCTLSEFEVRRALGLGNWTYEGSCVVGDPKEPRTVAVHGGLILANSPPFTRPTLFRIERGVKESIFQRCTAG